MNYKTCEKLSFNDYYKGKYPKKSWPILNEYFSRYKSEFNLSDEELYAKLGRTLENLNSIVYRGKGKDNVMGYFISSKKRIEVFSQENLDYDSILDTLFHEINHSNEVAGDHLKWGLGLNEIKTTMIARRLASNDGVDMVSSYREIVNVDGYSDLAFIGTMMQTSLGLSETEFLKLMDSGKENFDAEMVKKFNNPEDYNNFISAMKYNADALHAISYSGKTLTDNDIQNKTMITKNMMDFCMYTMQKRIEKELPTDVDEYEKYVVNCAYQYEKLKTNYKHGMSYISPDTDVENLGEWAERLTSTINTVNLVNTVGNRDERPKAIELVHNDICQNISPDFKCEFTKQKLIYNGISVSDTEPLVGKTLDMEYEMSLLRSDYGEEIWNNSEMKTCMDDFLSKPSLGEIFGIEKFKKIGEKIRNAFRKNGDTKLLEAADLKEVQKLNNDNKNSLSDSLSTMVNNTSEISRYINEENKYKEYGTKDDVDKGYEEI